MSYLRNGNSYESSVARVPYPGDPHSYYSFAAQALSKGALNPMQQHALYQQQLAYAGYGAQNMYSQAAANPIPAYGKFLK